MRYLAFVTDYDGTIAENSKVPDSTIAQLRRLKASGRKLILCTGREMRFLKPDFEELELFDLIVAENGATLFFPKTNQERLLADPPPEEFRQSLEARGVKPISFGKVIVATWEPHEKTVMEEIHRLGLDLHVIFNKGAVMVLPTGVTKCSGLVAALRELQLSPHNTVGAGDAENDLAFLKHCEFSVAVQNALPSLKKAVDEVTPLERGHGVEELIDWILKDDLQSKSSSRHNISIGRDEKDQSCFVSPYGESLLITGASGAGKTSFAAGLIERLQNRHYQVCIIDPEGDFEGAEGILTFGEIKTPPSVENVLKALKNPDQNVAINLLGVKLEDRPNFFMQLMPRLQELRAQFGRPHWIVIDEAHHMLAESEHLASQIFPQHLWSTLFVTVYPDQLSKSVLKTIKTAVSVGKNAQESMQDLFKVSGVASNKLRAFEVKNGEALIYQANQSIHKITIDLPKGSHLRHRRKYSEGILGPDRSFYFQGPHKKLNLRAQNLQMFLVMGDGVDEETWEFHRQHGDYSKWFRQIIKDEDLAGGAELVEKSDLTSVEARQKIRSLVEKLYTRSAE